MNKPLYRVEHRQIGTAVLVSVVCIRGDLEVRSNEKVLPPILEYNENGDFKIIGAQDIVMGMHFHPYKPLSKEFSPERLADLEVASLFKQLEHFPMLPQVVEGELTSTHSVAERIYKDLVYLKPTPKLAEYFNKLGYIKRCKVQPKILEKLVKNFEKQRGYKLDLFSVPKRRVGSFAYLADGDGIASVAKLFSFGFHKAIPCDRIARELSSLKSCEKFLNPVEVPIKLPDDIKPFVTMLRIAIVGTEYSMLDSGDLYPSSVPKIACRLSRHNNIKDVSLVPMEERNLVYRPFRSGIEVFHQEEKFIDETETAPGTVRLILPGGVKVAAQLQSSQAYDSSGTTVDALMAFDTFAKKGALAVFAMGDKQNYQKDLSLAECKEIFKGLKREKVYVNDVEYEGYIIEIPIMRPGQRYTELSKASDQITVDLIAKALLKKEYRVRPHIETEYQKLVDLRTAITREIASIA